MKKRIAWILVAAMLVSTLAGCQNSAAPSPTASPTDDPIETPVEGKPSTPGEHVLADFQTVVRSMEQPTARAVAEAMLGTEYIRCGGFLVSDIEAGSAAPGIQDLEALSFAACACFTPETHPSASIGYVFKLEEGADMDAFLLALYAQADPGYEVCMFADEVITGSEGNFALLFLCPADFAPLDAAAGEDDVPADDGGVPAEG